LIIALQNYFLWPKNEGIVAVPHLALTLKFDNYLAIAEYTQLLIYSTKPS